MRHRNTDRVRRGNLKERELLEYLGVGGKILLPENGSCANWLREREIPSSVRDFGLSPCRS